MTTSTGNLAAWRTSARSPMSSRRNSRRPTLHTRNTNGRPVILIGWRADCFRESGTAAWGRACRIATNMVRGGLEDGDRQKLGNTRGLRGCIRGDDHHRSRGRDHLHRAGGRFPHRRRSLYAGQHERLSLSTVQQRTAKCWRFQRWLHYPVRHLPELHDSARTQTMSSRSPRGHTGRAQCGAAPGPHRGDRPADALTSCCNRQSSPRAII